MLCLLLVAVSAPALAHAERSYSMFGLGGGAGVDAQPGIVLQGEVYGQDMEGGDSDGNGLLIGMHAGTRYWRVADTRWGLDVPIGLSFGAYSGPVRTSLGAGTGIAALELRGRDMGFGITPYANGRVGIELGRDWMTSLDLRATRAVLVGVADRTEFDIVLLVGKRQR